MALREQTICLWLAGDGGSKRQAGTAGILQDGKERTLQGNSLLSCLDKFPRHPPPSLSASRVTHPSIAETLCSRGVVPSRSGPSHEHEEELFHSEGDGALEQAAQGGCGDIQDLPGRCPVQPALDDPALAGGLD